MSRVIKFRVWNVNGNCMHQWLELVEKNKIHLLSNQQSAYPVMQFTGLHDVNGVEIYEGDIVSVIDTDHEDEKGMQDYYGGKRESRPTKEVSKDIATMERFPTFWLRNECFGYEGESLVSPKDCKVIGNIYQNPELLK